MQSLLDKKTKACSIATGIAAIATMLLWAYHVIQDLSYISFIIVWDAVGHVSVFDLVDYISILNWVLIRPLVVIIAMVLCVLYAFVYYGKKQNPLFGLSAIIIAAWYLFTLMMSVVFRMRFTSFTTSYILDVLANTLIAINFVIISLKHFNKIKFNIKILPVITILVSISTTILLSIIDNYFSAAIFLDMVYDASLLIPFMIFILFCPFDNKLYQQDIIQT